MLKEHLQRRIVAYFFVCTILLMGIVFGAIAVTNLDTDQKSDLTNYLSSFLQSFSADETVPKEVLARQSIMDNVVKTVGVMWLLGLSILGAPLILVVIFIRGFIIGFTVGFLVQEMFYQGIILAFASVLPHNIIILPAVILAGATAVNFSWSTIKVLMGKRDINIYHQLLVTTTLTCVAGGLLVAAAFVEAYITPVLLTFVNNYLI